MKFQNVVKWLVVMGILAVGGAILLSFCGCKTGDPGPVEDPHKPIYYLLNVIFAKAEQQFPGDETYGGEDLSPICDNWNNYTKTGGIEDNYSWYACTAFLDSLNIVFAEDTATYKINSNTLDGVIQYYDPYEQYGMQASSIRVFTQTLKTREITRSGLSGKCIFILDAAQRNADLLGIVAPEWENMPEGFVLGEVWYLKDSNGTPFKDYYDSLTPTGAIYTFSISLYHEYLQKEIVSLGDTDYDEDSWEGVGEFSFTKLVHSVYAHEIGHELGCYVPSHNADDKETPCAMRENSWSGVYVFTWKDTLRIRLFPICVCPTCASQFCPYSTFQE